MANAQTLRSLVSGSGTVSTTAGSKALAFSSAQSFKEGATVVVDPSGTPQLFTIDVGSGTSWTAMQSAASTVSGKSFDTSDPSTSRARGAGKIVPGARHTLYFSPLDAAAMGGRGPSRPSRPAGRCATARTAPRTCGTSSSRAGRAG